MVQRSTQVETYVPPFKTTSIQKLLKLSRAVVGSPKLSSDFCSTFLGRLLRSICDLAGPGTGLGWLTKNKNRQDRVLKKSCDLEEYGPHERVLPILWDLSMKDPYPGSKLLVDRARFGIAHEASIPIVKALLPFLLL